MELYKVDGDVYNVKHQPVMCDCCTKYYTVANRKGEKIYLFWNVTKKWKKAMEQATLLQRKLDEMKYGGKKLTKREMEKLDSLIGFLSDETLACDWKKVAYKEIY